MLFFKVDSGSLMLSASRIPGNRETIASAPNRGVESGPGFGTAILRARGPLGRLGCFKVVPLWLNWNLSKFRGGF